VARTTTGDESLSGVKRTGIFVLLVTVRKLYPSATGSTRQFSLPWTSYLTFLKIKI